MKHRTIRGVFAACLFLGATLYAQDFLEQGRSARAKGNIDQAVSCFLRAYEKSPKSEDVNFELGDALYEKGSLDSAEFFLLKAIKLDDEYIKAYISLGNLLRDKKEADQALPLFKTALKLDKNNFDATLGLGMAYIDVDSLDLATATCEKAKLINEKSPLPFVGLGQIWEKQHVYDFSIEQYQKAIKIDPKMIEPHAALANLYIKKKQYSDAIKELEYVIALDPINATAYLKAGRVFFLAAQSGHVQFYKDAIVKFLKYTELRSTSFEGWMYLGKSYYGDKNFTEATATFEKAVKLDTNSIEAQRLLGYSFFNDNKYSKSLDIMKSLIVKNEPAKKIVSEDYYKLAVSYVRTGDTLDAITNYEYATADTTQVDALNELAKLYMLRNQPDKAVQTFEKYISRNPKNAGAYYNAGNTLYGVQRYEDAAAYFDRGSAVNPDFLPFYFNEGWCYVLANQPNEGVKVFEAAMPHVEANIEKYEKDKKEQLGDFYFYYGNTLQMAKRFAQSQQMFAKMMKYRKEDATSHLAYVQAGFFAMDHTKKEENRSRYDDLEKHCRRALQLDSRNSEAMYWLSQVLIQSRYTGEYENNNKKKTEAKGLLEKALTIKKDKKYQDALDQL